MNTVCFAAWLLWCSNISLKGQCHEIFYPGFFHETTSPSHDRHAWKGFQIFLSIQEVIRICNRLPGVFTTVGLWLPGVFTSVESRLPCVIITGEPKLPGKEFTGKLTNIFFSKKLLVHNTLGSWDSPVINTLTSLYSLVFLSPENFIFNLFWCFFQIHQEVDSPVYSSQGSWDSRCIQHRKVETPWCIHHWGVVLDVKESFYWF